MWEGLRDITTCPEMQLPLQIINFRKRCDHNIIFDVTQKLEKIHKILKNFKMASRDEKIFFSESNTILQQATIDPEQAKNYLYVLDLEMIIARDPLQGFS